MIVVDAGGNVQGFSLSRTVKQYELGVDQEQADVKRVEEAVTDLNKQKIELMGKIEMIKEKKEQKKV